MNSSEDRGSQRLEIIKIPAGNIQIWYVKQQLLTALKKEDP